MSAARRACHDGQPEHTGAEPEHAGAEPEHTSAEPEHPVSGGW
ncbi:hypothetical protein ACN27J_14510 [Solwaraspora sp. WMMB762]